MKYKCLILDHDDTSVNSTAEIHYPAHVETIKQMRPGSVPVSLEGWFRKNFNPGVMEYFTAELNFTEDELKTEYDIWRKYNENSNPEFFPGILELIDNFQQSGGKVAVVSHSEADIIRRHYEVNGGGTMPDLIYGWDYDAEKRKPSVWPVRQIQEKFNLEPEDLLMIDDLKPGLEMARNSSIHIAGAGWGHSIPEIEEYMRSNCDYYFRNVSELSGFLNFG